ncbi:MAG TPA: apolipoprotein N-acyltransferase, partial [Paracoccaceae bacterium]|nr:apolipoprotein N-acyltransferase [Paracoccaceae bacterium]
ATIFNALNDQTELALMSQPDLVIWPETATPGMLRIDPISQQLLDTVASHGRAYLLAGSMDYRQEPGSDPEYLNTSFLISTNGQIVAAYDKRHLVLFGEILPFENQLSFVKRWSPLGFSCIPGDLNQPLIQIPTQVGPMTLSVLICFEDAFPYLARRDVRRGARLLINQTNDAWFDGSAASRQHMANAVMRAVENRVPMVRAANTGMTCFIDRFGRISERVLGSRGEGRARGFSVAAVDVFARSLPLTLYTRCGDWLFAIPCAMATLATLLFLFRQLLVERLRNGRQRAAAVGSRPS